MTDTALDADQTARLRGLLEARRDEARRLLEDIDTAAQPVTLDQQSVGRVSRIDAIQQQQMTLASQAQTRAQLAQAERALARLDAGEYGFCDDCGDAIGFGRLEVRPAANLCIACQQARETR